MLSLLHLPHPLTLGHSCIVAGMAMRSGIMCSWVSMPDGKPDASLTLIPQQGLTQFASGWSLLMAKEESRPSVANDEARRWGCAFWLPWQQGAASRFPTGLSLLFQGPHSVAPVLPQDRVGVESWGTTRIQSFTNANSVDEPQHAQD